MELKKYKLADIGKVITGKTPSTSIAENYAWGTIPFYTPEDVAKGLGMMGRNSRFISKTGFEEIASNTISGESVLVGCIGSDMGNVAYSNITCATNQQINAITQFKNGIDPLYVYYLLSTMKSYFQKIAGSTTTPILPKSIFEEIEIHLPDMKKQKDVVSILYALDRKIELNKQINDNLEAMAKQLYDYWFVQFDFPNEEGKPYKSSGGAMVWNEKLKREIPQGLGTPKIGDIEKNIITGKTPSCADEDNFGGDIPFVTIDDIRGNLFVFKAQRTLSTKGADSQEKKYLPIGSLSVSCIGTIGVMGFVARLAQTNQQINSIVFEHEYNKDFLYFSLKLHFENAKAKTGNVFANMSKEEFASIIVAYPPKQILQAFHNKVAPIFDSIKNNIEGINSLTKQRDELLPLLMNGQASVNYHLYVFSRTHFTLLLCPQKVQYYERY